MINVMPSSSRRLTPKRLPCIKLSKLRLNAWASFVANAKLEVLKTQSVNANAEAKVYQPNIISLKKERNG